MSTTPNSKLIENEVVFQRLNESIKTQIEVVFQGKARHMPLEFFCECSNEDCRARIRVDPAEYYAAHSTRRRFMCLPGHEVAKIERILQHCDGYNIIEKKEDPPLQTDMRLNKTDL